MEAQYSDIFIEAWNTVFESFSTKHITSAIVRAPKGQPDGRDIFVFMGIVGDVDGQIFMSMDTETGKVLASEMLGGMEITDVDEIVISAVGELCNMIMGNACSSISAGETNVDITPPTVVTEQNLPQMCSIPSYNISFKIEDMKAIDFDVTVKNA